jgi:hypothetical protein
MTDELPPRHHELRRLAGTQRGVLVSSRISDLKAGHSPVTSTKSLGENSDS